MDFLGKPACRGVALVGCRAPMRDGVFLAVDVYLPPDRLGEPLPCRIAFSPYGATAARSGDDIAFAARHGFACLEVDCRGRHNSGGSFQPWDASFADDAWDLLEWVSRQPWCNGRAVMFGGSYCAATQLACLRSGHPLLKACAPSAVTLDPYSIYYANGAQALAFIASWHIDICTPPPPPEAPSFDAVSGAFPLSAIPARRQTACPSWLDVVRHEGRDAFWAGKAALCDLPMSQAAVFYQGGWFDVLGAATFETFATLAGEVAPSAAGSPRAWSRLRVGPWGHGVNTLVGDVDYGPGAVVTSEAEDDFLAAGAAGRPPAAASNPARIEIFTMGRNQWRFIESWPPPGTERTSLYLGEGALLGRPPACAGGADRFDYDPRSPVPSLGGRMTDGGQKDQSAVEARGDVLVYTGDVLQAELEVTGCVEAVLHVASSAPDTDFTVKLVDVFPDGRPFNVCDGIMRCRWRDGLDRPDRLMAPGEHVRLAFPVDVTSYAFQPGHRVRVEISSSNFPRFARNTNTGRPVADDAEPVVAHQTVFRSAAEPSRVILPVVRPGGLS